MKKLSTNEKSAVVGGVTFSCNGHWDNTFRECYYSTTNFAKFLFHNLTRHYM